MINIYYFRTALLWGWLWTVPSARHCTGTVLWGLCGLHNWAARQVSPTQSRAPPQTPQHVLKGLSASPRVCTSVVRQGYNIITNGSDSKAGFPAEVRCIAGYCLMRKQWQVFIEFAGKSQFSWSTTHLTGRLKVSVVLHGCTEQFREHLMQMSFLRVVLVFLVGYTCMVWRKWGVLSPFPQFSSTLWEVAGRSSWNWGGDGVLGAAWLQALSSWSCAWEMGRGSKAFSVPSFPDKSTPCSGLFLGVIFWVISCSCTICLNLQMKQYLKEIGAVSIHLCSV